MADKYNVAVVGATGVVGEALLKILHEREFPIDNIVALASERSAGNTVLFGNKSLVVKDLAEFDFADIDFAFFMASNEVAKKYARKAADQNTTVIDNSSCFRYDQDIPLVVPEVNPEALVSYHSQIIANPNCSTIQMAVAVKPIYDQVGIKRINVSTYQAVSGAGREAIDELAKQTAALFNGQEAETEVFGKPIAFNVIPHIDEFQDNGYTREEMKMVLEMQKIFNDPNLLVNPTAVRVPVFYGHAEAIHMETAEPIDAATAKSILEKIPGIDVVDDDNTYATPISHAATSDEVFISRIRNDISHPNGLNMWVVADNVRKGAALNAVQIAELLVMKNEAVKH
ncbi:MAG: aspartate-semialdehyde dehydrogenase [Coxiellaceae bacterium]|nr:aspartate-semialdehyde dehydrogenase [Coxiellaceae bacterium]